MDTLVAAIVTTSQAGNWSSLNTYLRETRASLGNVTSTQLLPVLSVLDVNLHSLGWCHILAHICGTGELKSNVELVQLASRFLTNCDAHQVQRVSDVFANVCSSFAEASIALGVSHSALNPLMSAIRKSQPSPQHLTAAHAEFLKVALHSHNFSAALALLEEDICEINPEETNVVILDYLLYHYYGGLIFLGLKKYGDAIEYFQRVVSVPAKQASAVIIEAHKKCILASLIESGSEPELPPFTSVVITRTINSTCKAYTSLAKAYEKLKRADFERTMNKYADLFNQDGNTSLVRQVEKSLVRRIIQKLTLTYLTLSLKDMADKVGLASPEAAEDYILRMIQEGETNAVVDHQKGMVSFEPSAERFDSAALTAKLEKRIEQAISISDVLKGLDQSLHLSSGYLRAIVSQPKPHYESRGFDADAMDP